jgi:hypothetical protein
MILVAHIVDPSQADDDATCPQLERPQPASA